MRFAWTGAGAGWLGAQPLHPATRPSPCPPTNTWKSQNTHRHPEDDVFEQSRILQLPLLVTNLHVAFFQDAQAHGRLVGRAEHGLQVLRLGQYAPGHVGKDGRRLQHLVQVGLANGGGRSVRAVGRGVVGSALHPQSVTRPAARGAPTRPASARTPPALQGQPPPATAPVNACRPPRLPLPTPPLPPLPLTCRPASWRSCSCSTPPRTSCPACGSGRPQCW